jgi:hypothetical protein
MRGKNQYKSRVKEEGVGRNASESRLCEKKNIASYMPEKADGFKKLGLYFRLRCDATKAGRGLVDKTFRIEN